MLIGNKLLQNTIHGNALQVMPLVLTASNNALMSVIIIIIISSLPSYALLVLGKQKL